MTRAVINAVHQSKPMGRPIGFGTHEISHESKAMLQNLAAEIFSDMANQGHSFQDCLLAVLASGMQFAIEGEATS